MATRMRRYEVRNNLLVQVLLAIDAVEDALELFKLLERRLAHKHQHTVAGMLGGNLQTTADMVADKFASVFLG